MNAEFVDTNILAYANDRSADAKYQASVVLLTRLVELGIGAVSTQVLSEFYSVATKKLAMTSEEAEEVIQDMSSWKLHRPSQADIVRACRLHRLHKVSWWDALILNSAIEMGCSVLWTEDLSHGQRYGSVTVRNPFRDPVY